MGNFISGLSQTAEQALKGYKLDGLYFDLDGALAITDLIVKCLLLSSFFTHLPLSS